MQELLNTEGGKLNI